MADAGPVAPLEASPTDPRLARAIRTASVQQQAAELVRLALGALSDLRHLDDSLYDQFVATRHAPAAAAPDAADLVRLWDETFAGLHELLDHCHRLVAAAPSAAAAAGASDAGLDDLDFGEGHAPAARREEHLDLGVSDIGSLLEGIGGLADDDHSDHEHWTQVVEQVGPLEYGLRSQQRDAVERREVALAAGKLRQVLAILDDAQSAASEGVHAIIAAVYHVFAPEADPARLVPGYLTALGRALLVRRGLAELRRQIEPLNAELQGPDAGRHEAALAEVRRAMDLFVSSATCRAMRAADRWQMEHFEQQLAGESLHRARQTCEGLAKYLESLASVNQREVLIVHDQRRLGEMRDLLANGRQLLELSPRTAEEMLTKAYQAARALRGCNPVFDQQLEEVEAVAGDGGPPEASLAWLERVEHLLAAAGG